MCEVESDTSFMPDMMPTVPEEPSPPAKKARVEAKPDDHICNIMRPKSHLLEGAAKNITVDLVTKPTSKRTMWEIKVSGKKDCMLYGKVFDAAVAPSVIAIPHPKFGTTDRITISLVPADASSFWPSATDDFAEARAELKSMQQPILAKTIVPLLRSGDSIPGLPKQKMQQWSKLVKPHEDDMDAANALLEANVLVGKGTSETSDFVNFARKVYAEQDSSVSEMSESAYRLRGIDVQHQNVVPAPWPYNESVTMPKGSAGMLFFRIMFQVTAGNCHITLQPYRFIVHGGEPLDPLKELRDSIGF